MLPGCRRRHRPACHASVGLGWQLTEQALKFVLGVVARVHLDVLDTAMLTVHCSVAAMAPTCLVVHLVSTRLGVGAVHLLRPAVVVVGLLRMPTRRGRTGNDQGVDGGATCTPDLRTLALGLPILDVSDQFVTRLGGHQPIVIAPDRGGF